MIRPGEIRRQLTYKSDWYGLRLIAVDPAYTSQTCEAYGKVDAASRVTRSRFVCTCCGHRANTDVNDANVILGRGLSALGLAIAA